MGSRLYSLFLKNGSVVPAHAHQPLVVHIQLLQQLFNTRVSHKTKANEMFCWGLPITTQSEKVAHFSEHSLKLSSVDHRINSFHNCSGFFGSSPHLYSSLSNNGLETSWGDWAIVFPPFRGLTHLFLLEFYMGPRGRHWSGASVIPLLVEQRQDDPQSLLESQLA